MSDTHDHISQTRQALECFSEERVDAIIHCGDFCAPFMIEIFDEVGVEFHCVFGNIDDRFRTTRMADAASNVTLHGDTAELMFDGKRIGVVHYPEPARRMAESGAYELVLFGHTHRTHEERIGETILCNPGEVMGRFGTRTVALYDTQTGELRSYDLTR